MELRIHRPGSICLPPVQPPQWARALGDACRQTGHRMANTFRRHATATRIGLYSAAGTVSATAATLAGMDPADAVSLGMNVVATAAAFWPPTNTSEPAGGTEAC
jgi:hypothetical protein